MNVSDAIRLKRSVRKFTNRPLPEEAVLAILNAGRRTQSSKNTQPWHFIAITDKATLQQLSKCGEWVGHLAGVASQRGESLLEAVEQETTAASDHPWQVWG